MTNVPIVLCFGGPAGAGKTTLADAWAAGRPRAARVELDLVRSFIRGGYTDPQIVTPAQMEQYETSVRVCVALARAFVDDGYDVALDDVFEPEPFARFWRPLLGGLSWHVVIVRPSLEETLRRARARHKDVLEEHTLSQHAATGRWGADVVLDTTAMTVDEALAAIERRGYA